MDYLSFMDLIIAPILLIFFFIIANAIKARHIEQEPYYKYFVPALFLKVFGGIGVCLVYVYYYNGGDTTGYYIDNTCVSRLFLKDPSLAMEFTFFPINE